MRDEFIEMGLHALFFAFIGGLFLFFIAFFGTLGWKAGEGFVHMLTGSETQSSNF